MNPNLEYRVMLPPSANINLPMTIWGGAGSSFVVNASSVNRDKSIVFLKWLTDKDQQVFLAETTKNLPSNKNALSFIPQILSDFAKAMENTTHPTVWPLNEDPLVVKAFDKGLQAIIIGEKTPEEVAKEVQQVKEYGFKKAKRVTTQ